MNLMTEFLQSPWLNTLAYTLLHSLWQGALIVIIVIALLRLTPNRWSNVRYAIASLGLLLLIGAAAGTFLVLNAKVPLTSHVTLSQTGGFSQDNHSTLESLTMTSVIDVVSAFVHTNIPFFLILWVVGTFVFCLRVIGGLLYVGRLRREAIVIDGDWSTKLQKLSNQLGISRCVLLAASPSIAAPVVAGIIKPIILIPIGMLTSLSTEQLETIFLHELVHIKRRDFLINLIQSFVEAIFFFNPFSWILSNLIKREREHCCDDAVIKLHGNALAYAHALSTLEEVRLTKVGLSLSLAQNKNQLLNRITRIMEKSVKNYSGRERIIPAALLIIGLICASWISTQTGRNEIAYRQAVNEQLVQDTTKKSKRIKKERNATTQSSKEKHSSNQNEKTIDKQENKDDVSFHPGPMPEPGFEIPPPPHGNMTLPPTPDIEISDFDVPHMQWRTEDEWETFGKEFGERFQEKFGEFYEKHGADIQQMIQEIEKDVTSKFDDELKMQDYASRRQEWAEKQQARMLDYASRQQEWAEKQAEQFAKQAEQLARRIEDDQRAASKIHAEKAEKLSEDVQKLHKDKLEENHKRFEERMKAFEERTHRFEEEMKEELIKDGYLEKDEKLTNMHWQNGSIKINGEKIKPEHEKKYNDLHKKYFEDKAFKAVE
jgi:bla regulator protein blaR1